MHKYIALGLLSVLLMGCQTLQQRADAPLGAAEVERLFVGNTVESYNLNTRFNSFTYYHPNGQAIQERLWSRRLGTWSIRDDGQICLAFTEKPAKCRSIVLDGGRYYKLRMDKKGRPEKIVRYRYFAQGNALGSK
jgi:hypothetical protein